MKRRRFCTNKQNDSPSNPGLIQKIAILGCARELREPLEKEESERSAWGLGSSCQEGGEEQFWAEVERNRRKGY